MGRRPVIPTLAIGISLSGLLSFCVQDQEVVRKSDVLQAVRVTTDKLSYRRGQPIFVTIRNDLSTVIYPSPRQRYCSVVNVQRLEAGQWVTQGSCPAGGPTAVSAIAPHSQMKGTVGPAAPDTGTQRPIVTEPSVPGVFEGDVRTRPTAERWKPGDPIREVPRGRIPFSVLRGEIDPGTYRIEFRFTVSPTSGPVQAAYSEKFVMGA